jgi:hypothetical protein
VYRCTVEPRHKHIGYKNTWVLRIHFTVPSFFWCKIRITSVLEYILKDYGSRVLCGRDILIKGVNIISIRYLAREYRNFRGILQDLPSKLPYILISNTS